MRKFTLLLLVCFTAVSLFAQVDPRQMVNPTSPAPEEYKSKAMPPQEHNHNGTDQIRLRKISYFSEKIDFTPEEAQKFWPLYNQMVRELGTIISERNRNVRNVRRGQSKDKTLSEQQMEQMMDAYIDSFAKESEIKKRYYQEFKKFLPAPKLSAFYYAEDSFNNMLIREWVEKQVEKQVEKRSTK